MTLTFRALTPLVGLLLTLTFTGCQNQNTVKAQLSTDANSAAKVLDPNTDCDYPLKPSYPYTEEERRVYLARLEANLTKCMALVGR